MNAPKTLDIILSRVIAHNILCAFSAALYWNHVREALCTGMRDQKYEYDGENSEKKKITIVTNMRTIQHFISECFSELIFNVEKSNASRLYSIPMRKKKFHGKFMILS